MSQTVAAAPPTTKDDEADFIPEEVTEIATAIIEKVLGENTYSENRVSVWTTQIIEKVLTDLSRLRRPFKYIVTCALQQRTGAGLHVITANYYNSFTDGACTVKWDNKYIHCCVHVLGIQI